MRRTFACKCLDGSRRNAATPTLMPAQTGSMETKRAQLPLDIEASATCTAATGVEMEALTAASVAALTVYDMCKAAHKGIRISEIKLIRKEGGKSGVWTLSDRS